MPSQQDPPRPDFHVVVVGAGNAALCAALAAREQGAAVTVLERAPHGEHGGNSHFTMAAMRFAYDGIEDLLEVAPELSADEIERTDFGRYPEAAFLADLERVTEGRSDPRLARVLVERSRATLHWMHSKGVRFTPLYGGQAYDVDGRFTFWGGLTLQARDGGPGLVAALLRAAKESGIEVRYDSRALDLELEARRVTGLAIECGDRRESVKADAVVLACGGFEANAELRARHLGADWRHAKVRGTRFNEGDGIRMALAAGAGRAGDWPGCHAVGWDRNAPAFGNLAVRHLYQKHSYPLGILVNADGRRFVDEGADFRNYTYAKYGARILAQPGRFAWQVFDSRVLDLLRDEYRVEHATRVRADDLEELAAGLDGVDSEAFLETVRRFNAAVDLDIPFDPNVKDGRSTTGLDIDKSNWANPIDEPPFEAYAVTCGITFTFGGLAIDEAARVLDRDGEPIGGLFAAGELVGGLFWGNYPGGAGLTAGAVFGRIAGTSAGSGG